MRDRLLSQLAAALLMSCVIVVPVLGATRPVGNHAIPPGPAGMVIPPGATWPDLGNSPLGARKIDNILLAGAVPATGSDVVTASDLTPGQPYRLPAASGITAGDTAAASAVIGGGSGVTQSTPEASTGGYHLGESTAGSQTNAGTLFWGGGTTNTTTTDPQTATGDSESHVKLWDEARQQPPTTDRVLAVDSTARGLVQARGGALIPSQAK